MMKSFAGGYMDVPVCEQPFYTRFSWDAARANDQYLFYLFMRNDTMSGYTKKYKNDFVAAYRQHLFAPDTLEGTYNYLGTPLVPTDVNKMISKMLREELNVEFV